jgi:hypothetical protein
MSNPFFDHPILNSPYESSMRHWELDKTGQPTQKIIERRRSAKFITPIPKPKKQGRRTNGIVFDEGKGLSTKEQQYDPTSIINEVRGYVDTWRLLTPSQWQVTPETARLLQHWRQHSFIGVRPFFCQVEAAENPPRRRDQRRAAPVRPPPLSKACEETVELPGRLRALARAPLRDQEVPPRRRDQGPGVPARRDVDSPSRIAVHERGRRGALVQLRIWNWQTLLQKSFCTRDQNFFWLYTRLSCKICGGPHCLKINSLATSVT